MSDSSPSGPTDQPAPLRLGSVDACAGGEAGVTWRMARSPSLTPRQLVVLFGVLSALSAAIAVSFWLRGAPLVLPFAALELLVLGAALLIHARHAADAERIRLDARHLTVEHSCGARTERVEFQPAWVRVEPALGDGSLVELSGQGRRVTVGRYVRPELRMQLAKELRWALRRRPALAGGVVA